MRAGRVWVLGECVGFAGLLAYVWFDHGRCLSELLSFHPWESTGIVLATMMFATMVIELTAALLVRMVESAQMVRAQAARRRAPALSHATRRMGEARQALGAPVRW